MPIPFVVQLSTAGGSRESAADPKVTVVIPTHRGSDYVTECLDSLAAQTLASPDFEVVLVHNGDPDGTAEVVEEWSRAYPGFPLVYLDEPLVSSAPVARNIGIDHARGEYITFIDDDDRVAPRFLEALLSEAEPDVITGVLIGWVEDDDFEHPSLDNYISRELVPRLGQPNDNLDLAVFVAYTPAKLVLTEIARAVRFDEQLAKGQDVVFWTSVVAEAPLRLRLVDAGLEAAYFYRIRRGSLMRHGEVPTWEHNIEPRLKVLKALERIEPADAVTESIQRRMIANFSRSFVGDYLMAHPEELSRVDQALVDYGLRNIPWRVLHEGMARSIAIVDLADPVARKHFEEYGELADVVAIAPGGVVTDEMLAGVERYVDWTSGAHFTTGGWIDFSGCAAAVIDFVADAIEKKGPYRSIISISSRPADHLVAALLKAVLPQSRWAADVVGELVEPFDSRVVGAEEIAILQGALAEQGVDLGRRLEPAFVARLAIGALAEQSAATVPAPSRPAMPSAPLQVQQEPVRPPAAPRRISVILPTYRGVEWLRDCLDSLAVQTLPFDEFEVVVVENGEVCGTAAVVTDVEAAYPGMNLSYAYNDVANLSAARNLGLGIAVGEYVTFVDDDDRVGRSYLEALLADAAPDTVSGVLVAFVKEWDFEHPTYANWISKKLLPHLGRAASTEDLQVLLAYPHGKAVSLQLAREIGFDEHLRAGEDLVFWMRVLSTGRVQLALANVGMEGAYIYNERFGSLMRFGIAPSWEYAVEWRLDVLRALEDLRIPAGRDDIAAVRAHYLRNHCEAFTKLYLQRFPHQVGRVDRTLSGYGLKAVPWPALHRGIARDVAILRAPGRSDRLVRSGVPTDVIMAVPSADVARAEYAALAPVIDHVALVEAVSLYSGEPAFAAVSELVTRVEREEGFKRGPYRSIHSSSAGYAEHLAAAVVCLSRPGMRWTAEFVDGPEAQWSDVSDALRDVLRKLLDRVGITDARLLQDAYAATLVIALMLADEVVFSSAEQRAEIAAAVAGTPLAERLATVGRLASEIAFAAGESGAPETVATAVVTVTAEASGLPATLDALRSQTTDHDAFEVVVVHADGVDVEADVHGLRADGIRIRTLAVAGGSAQGLVDAGTSVACGEFVTVVRAGEVMGPRYLEALLVHAAADVIVCGPIAERISAGPAAGSWPTSVVVSDDLANLDEAASVTGWILPTALVSVGRSRLAWAQSERHFLQAVVEDGARHVELIASFPGAEYVRGLAQQVVASEYAAAH